MSMSRSTSPRRESNSPQGARSLIIACGAIARELTVLLRASGLDQIRVVCLPADLHNTPDKIPTAVREILDRDGGRHTNLFVAYADCGTGGQLDRVLAEYDVERLPGSHCYEFFAGSALFASLHEQEPGTFYLTDFLVRHFERLVIKGLGLDRHPELLPTYFGNYKRVVYLAQQHSPELEIRARACAERLELEFEMRNPGLAEFARALGPVAHDPEALENRLESMFDDRSLDEIARASGLAKPAMQPAPDA